MLAVICTSPHRTPASHRWLLIHVTNVRTGGSSSIRTRVKGALRSTRPAALRWAFASVCAWARRMLSDWTEIDAGRVPDQLAHVVVRLEPVPAWLRHVVDVVLSDMQRPRPIDVRIGYDAHGSGPASFGSASRTVAAPPVYGVNDDYAARQTDAARLVEFAYWLQDQFFAETDQASAEARPECPGHPHPAVPEELDGAAWWVCPIDDRRIAMIGALGPGRRASAR